VCHPALDAGSTTLIHTKYYIDPGSKAGMTKYPIILFYPVILYYDKKN